MLVFETPRLRVRHLGAGDAAFILQLLNEPSWLKNIGDKGVRTLDDAERYIRNTPTAMRERHGHSANALVRKSDGQLIGTCGLIKRDSLQHPDLGFALLPEFWRQGYAFEAATATLEHGSRMLGHTRVLAITSPGNLASSSLLEKLGFQYERLMALPPTGELLRLYRWQAGETAGASG